MGHCTEVGPGVKQQYVVNICDGWAYQCMYYVWNIIFTMLIKLYSSVRQLLNNDFWMFFDLLIVLYPETSQIK